MGFRQCMITPNRGATIARTLKKIRSMAPGRPDLIVTNCPGCTAFLDKGQWTIHELKGESPFIPVLNYVELAGLLLGWDPYEAVGIQFHTVPVEPLLERIGIPFDRSRSSLEGRPYGVGPAFAGPPTAG
jgi:heterodisulfide reductase subunit B